VSAIPALPAPTTTHASLSPMIQSAGDLHERIRLRYDTDIPFNADEEELLHHWKDFFGERRNMSREYGVARKFEGPCSGILRATGDW